MVLSGGINTISTSEPVHTAHKVLCAACRDVIEVKGYYIPTGYRSSLATVAFERAGYKATDILQIILLPFRVAEIIVKLFPSPYGGLQFFDQLGP